MVMLPSREQDLGINYINDIIEAEQTIEMPSAYSDGGKVNVMTIHNSKGLEFPVCFIAATRKRARSDSGVIQFDEKIGVGASFGDESGLIKYENLIRQIMIAKNAREELEEQMRVLYVAMTRARERLYISAGVKGSSYMDEAQRRAYISDSFSVMSCSNYFDWVCTAYYAMDEKTRDMIEFSTICDEDIPEISPVSDRGEKEKSEGINEEDISALIDVFRERFDFEYPYSHLEKIPAKLSVSGLYPAVLDDGEGESLLDDEVDICSMPAFLIPKEERASGAEKGTATHTFLQFCDFDAAETSVEAEIARLEEQGFISREMSELISVSMLRRFFESRFYAFIKDSLKNGGRIYREQRFNIAMPAALFTENDSLRERIENEMIVVQGVIDLIVVDRNGDIILCDYKTDHLSKEELSSAFLAAKKLSERYSQQLSYYSVAVERLFGKAPIKTYIYSLPFGDALPLG